MKLLLDENLSRRLVPFLPNPSRGLVLNALLAQRDAIQQAIADGVAGCIEIGRAND
jgi:predicted nuclease of predicted toxin-antitoxin system